MRRPLQSASLPQRSALLALIHVERGALRPACAPRHSARAHRPTQLQQWPTPRAIPTAARPSSFLSHSANSPLDLPRSSVREPSRRVVRREATSPEKNALVCFERRPPRSRDPHDSRLPPCARGGSARGLARRPRGGTRAHCAPRPPTLAARAPRLQSRPRSRASLPSSTRARACIMRAAAGLGRPVASATSSQEAPAKLRSTMSSR